MSLVANVPAQLVQSPPATYSWTPPTPLQRGRTYTWKVVSRTFATAVNSAIIATSETRTFKTEGGSTFSDFDGDARADFAVYRPSNGTWYIVNSSGAPSTTAWGSGADRPVAGDYDGDGKTDVAVFRPSTGVWYILQSSTAMGRVATWGGGADIPVSADYDGDGKADIAVFRPSTGVWYILRSSMATGSVTAWGGGADIPHCMNNHRARYYSRRIARPHRAALRGARRGSRD